MLGYISLPRQGLPETARYFAVPEASEIVLVSFPLCGESFTAECLLEARKWGVLQGVNPPLARDKSLVTCSILVERRSWRDRNLKFGPNFDLEVDNLEKNLNDDCFNFTTGPV